VSITKQGTTKIVAASGGVATVVFDSTPALGDLIVIEAFAATTGPTMGASGFSNGGQAPNSAGNRFAYQFFKIAGGSETNSYGVNVSGVNNGVIGRVFRATNGFKSAAECIATVNSGGAATTMTADPAGVPSNASSVEISTFNSGVFFEHVSDTCVRWWVDTGVRHASGGPGILRVQDRDERSGGYEGRVGIVGEFVVALRSDRRLRRELR
jgi:hypothetical protein